MNKIRIHMDLLTIVVVSLLAFGLQILTLGFFQDDWNFVYYSSARGAQGLLDFVRVDGRPGAAWLYILGFNILGYKPALWQFFSLLLRVLTTINFWLILNRLWPNRRYGNLITCIFFVAYPFFVLQPLAVSFTQHFMAYFLFSLSILLMIKALETPDRYLQFSIPAVLMTFLHLFTMEYFVGLELLRPLIIWFFLSSRENKPRRELLGKVLQLWLPYLLALAFFIVWRSSLSVSTGVRNSPFKMLLDSGQTIVSVAQNIFADLVLMLASPWLQLIEPESFVIGPSRNFYYLAITIVGAVCYFFLTRPIHREDTRISELKPVFLAGVLIVATGMISTYAVGFIVHLKNAPWNTRFALPALLGLSMLSAAAVELVITSKNMRHIVLAILVGLLIGRHNQNTLDFKTAWEKQTRLYEQLVWRAPAIQPNTAIIANDEILGYMGDYPTSFAINTIYGSKRISGIPYWFFALSENFDASAEEATGTGPLTSERAIASFQGSKQDILFITYEPENKQCLWILRPADADYKYLPTEMKKAALFSNYNTIQPHATEHQLYDQIVRENRGTWCYFYQKADLARQLGDWETVTALWQEAQSKGFQPDNGFEYIPFIEAYAHLGKWEDAFLLTKASNRTTKGMYLILCPTWERLVHDADPTTDQGDFLQKSYDLLGCVTE